MTTVVGVQLLTQPHSQISCVRNRETDAQAIAFGIEPQRQVRAFGMYLEHGGDLRIIQ